MNTATTSHNETVKRLTKTTSVVFIGSGLFILFSFFGLFYLSQKKSAQINELENRLEHQPKDTSKATATTETTIKVDTVVVYKTDTIYRRDTVAFKVGSDLVNLKNIGRNTKSEAKSSIFKYGDLKSYTYTFFSYGQDTTRLNRLVNGIEQLIGREGFQ